MVLNQKKNLLIISFHFPPYPKVGGRRWAKFAKYLTRKGYNVHVLCAGFEEDKASPWDQDIITFSDNITRLKYRFKNYFFQERKTPVNLIEKIRWKASYFIYQLKQEKIKGNKLDISIDKTNDFLLAAIPLIKKNNYKNIIVSGGPFRYVYALRKLKIAFKDLHMIFDMRDFWSDWLLYDDEKVYLFEKEIEAITLKEYDTIITPAERIKEQLLTNYSWLVEKKIKIIPHAFDQDDFDMVNYTVLPNASENSIRIAYIGALYNNMNNNIVEIINLLKLLDSRGIECSLDIYSFHRNYEDIIAKEKADKLIQFKRPLPINKLLHTLYLDYDILLYLRSDLHFDQHFFSTKFFDMLALKKPILYAGPEGDVSGFIRKNNLGFCLNDGITLCADTIMHTQKTKNIPDPSIDIQKYSLERVTEQLENILI